MISVICVYNNKAVLCNCLLKGLDRQSADYELILLDNTGNNYRSAAEALNKGGRDAKGDYLMFAHQDVQLFSKDWLENVESRLRLLPNLGIAGVAGNLEMIKGLVSNLKHGEPPRLAGNIEIERPEKVQTLDECLILIPRAVFFLQKFDEETCDDWHLYAVDYCLSIKKLGYDVYVIPDYVYHLSHGNLSKGYYRTLKKVIAKHKDAYPIIYASVGVWNTAYPVSVLRLIKLKYKMISRYLRFKGSVKRAAKYAMGRGSW